MKRCIICGNIEKDSSTVCSVCGNPCVEMISEHEGTPYEADGKMEAMLQEGCAQIMESDAFGQMEEAEEDYGMYDPSKPDSDPASGFEGSVPGSRIPLKTYETAFPADSGFSSDWFESAQPEEIQTLVEEAREESLLREQSAAAGQPIYGEDPEGLAGRTENEAGYAGQNPQAGSPKGAHIYGEQLEMQYGAQTGDSPVPETGYGYGEDTASEGYPEAAESGASRSRLGRNARRKSKRGSTGGRAVPSGRQNADGGSAAYDGVQENRMPQRDRPSGRSRNVSDAAQTAIGSPLLVAAAFFQTLYFAGSIWAIILRQLNYGQFAKLLNLLDLPPFLSGYADLFQSAMAQLDSGALALNLLIRLPDLLFCIGLWLLCVTVHASEDKMPCAGFVFMRIVAVLRMIGTCAALFAVLVLSVASSASYWGEDTQNLTVSIIVLLAAAVVTFAAFVYHFGCLSTIRVINGNARDGAVCGEVSVYAASVTMVISLTGIVSILSGIVNLEVTGIVTGAGRILWMVLFGIWILKYKSAMRGCNES